MSPDLDLSAVPGRYELMVVGAPKAGRAPEPEHWCSELVYSAVVSGCVPAVPVTPVLIGAAPPSAPVHVRDQLAAYEREHSDRKAWCIGLALTGIRIVDVATDYLELPVWITRGRDSNTLGDDPVFSELISTALHDLIPDGRMMAAAIITNPRGLTHDLVRIPADTHRRNTLAVRLKAGGLGAVIAVAHGRVVLPA